MPRLRAFSFVIFMASIAALSMEKPQASGLDHCQLQDSCGLSVGCEGACGCTCDGWTLCYPIGNDGFCTIIYSMDE